MGHVYAELELINAGDLEMVRRNLLEKEEIKRINVEMLIDSGSYYMCINEIVKEQLDLQILEKRIGQLANGQIVENEVSGPIEVRFKNRRCLVDAMVQPGDSEMLLGAIPMEDMAVLIHPLRQELVVNPEHPNYVQMKMKGVRKLTY